MALSLRHLISLIILPLGFVASAGTAAPVTEATSIEFTVFARLRPRSLQFFPDAKSQPQKLEFFGNTRSPSYTVKGGRQIPIYATLDLNAYFKALAAAPADNPPPKPVPVAVADIPEGITRALLLFIPVPDPTPSGPAMRIYVVDDSPRTLPAGYASVINASGREYKAKLGDELLDVPHGIGGKVPVKGTVELRLAARDGDGWVVGGRHTFKLGENNRVSLVFFPPTSPTGIAPIIRTLIEDVVPEGTADSPTQVAAAGR